MGLILRNALLALNQEENRPRKARFGLCLDLACSVIV